MALLEPITVVEIAIDNRTRADVSAKFVYERAQARLTIVLQNRGQLFALEGPPRIDVKGY